MKISKRGKKEKEVLGSFRGGGRMKNNRKNL